ncbi:MAG: hypothetical protein AMS27_09280 [Bacteroides sp. SM23_62_1]|nr:MAG: hypothetical protein AMS27_09280 [Bacteroides sp. SM23_62_1]
MKGKNYMKKLLFIGLWISVFCFSSVIAQMPDGGPSGYSPENMPKDGYMKGIILDEVTDEPVEFASVALYSQRDSLLVTGTITDMTGQFEFKELSYGAYYADIRFVGYKNTRMSSIVVSPQNKTIDLGEVKVERSVTELDEVKIVAERPQMEYKIDRKVVYVESNITAAGGTAVDVLENTPSIQTDIDGNITLRGSSNFTVLIDNKPSVLEGSEALQQIPASSIERIEIITNPSAKYDPDGTAGIINVIMKKQRLQGFNGIVNGSYGSFNQYSGDVLLNYRLNKFNLFAGFNIQNRSMQGSGSSERESYLNDTTYYLLSDEQNEMGGTGSGFKTGFDFYPDGNNTISLQANIGSRGFGRSSISQYHEFSMPSIADYYYLQKSGSERNSDFYSLTLNYDHNFGNPEHKLQASLFYSRDNDSDFEELKDTDTDASWIGNDAEPYIQRTLESGDENEFRFNLDYYRPVGKEGKFETGYQLRYESGTTDYLFDLYDHNLNAWSNVEGRNNNVELARNIQSGYAIFGTSTKIVDFQVGLRAEYADRVIHQISMDEQYKINRIDLFPSAYLTKQLPFEQQLQLSYSRRINRPREFFLDPFPTYMDLLNIQIGNPGLEPEYVDSYELNWQKKIKTTFVAAELYYRQTNNMMSRVTSLRDDNIMIHTMDNIGTDHSLGTEVMVTASPFRWWELNASGTMFHYRINGEIEGEDVSQQTNTWNARLNNNFKLKWDTRIQLMSFYNAPSITAQGERGGFFMINAGIRQDFLDNKLTATFQVRDIFSTMKMSFTSEGSNFYTHNERMPRSPVFTISLSYRINNYKKRQVNNGSDTNEIQFQDPESF